MVNDRAAVALPAGRRRTPSSTDIAMQRPSARQSPRDNTGTSTRITGRPSRASNSIEGVTFPTFTPAARRAAYQLLSVFHLGAIDDTRLRLALGSLRIASWGDPTDLPTPTTMSAQAAADGGLFALFLLIVGAELHTKAAIVTLANDLVAAYRASAEPRAHRAKMSRR